MEGISDIRISGIDEKQPPRIRKEPYINIFFKLNHKAPKDWCDDFNRLVAKRKYPVKIDPATGLIIETWVRKMEEIENLLEELKQAVRQCNQDYIARILAHTNAALITDGEQDNSGEQGRLNLIVAGLNYD